ncbi:MFS transporter permease [Thermococcus profundus]|uniref:MFS transporter permease n=1 Tax=Thermococcus profundus TaxID=49899 RepID=A0A2Z2MCR9_THEPR|nr:MFS transporter [Thermococcus profundus]ASJ02375.1 MFS transporter permease [Thermococcus profundus]
MPLSRYAGFSRDAYLVVLYSFFGWLGGNIAWFIVPFYFKSLGMDYTNMGVLFSLSTIAQAVLLLFTGPLSVKIGYKRSIILALTFFASGRLIQVFLPEFLFLAIASVLLGVGMALEGPALMSLLSEEARDENRHYLFSLNSAMGTFGAAFGTFLGGFLPGVLDGENPYRDTLMVSVGFIFLQLAVISLVHPILDRKGRQIKFERETVIKILKFSLPSALIGLGAGVTIPYMGLWFNRKFGTSLESIGGLFAIQQFIMGLGTFLLPALADKLGSVKTIVGFNGSATVLIAGMPFLPTFPLAALVYIVRTILMNIVNPIWDAFMMRFFSTEERSTALALRNLSWTATFGIGQYVGGLIFDRSLTIPFLVTGILYGASMVSFWRLFSREEK